MQGRDVLSYVAEYGTPLEERDSPDGGVCTALVACVPASFVDEETGVESPFVIEEGDIERALSEESEAIGATVDVDVPDRLISEEDLAALMEQRQPSFVESPENQVLDEEDSSRIKNSHATGFATYEAHVCCSVCVLSTPVAFAYPN